MGNSFKSLCGLGERQLLMYFVYPSAFILIQIQDFEYFLYDDQKLNQVYKILYIIIEIIHNYFNNYKPKDVRY